MIESRFFVFLSIWQDSFRLEFKARFFFHSSDRNLAWNQGYFEILAIRFCFLFFINIRQGSFRLGRQARFFFLSFAKEYCQKYQIYQGLSWSIKKNKHLERTDPRRSTSATRSNRCIAMHLNSIETWKNNLLERSSNLVKVKNQKQWYDHLRQLCAGHHWTKEFIIIK